MHGLGLGSHASLPSSLAQEAAQGEAAAAGGGGGGGASSAWGEGFDEDFDAAPTAVVLPSTRGPQGLVMGFSANALPGATLAGAGDLTSGCTMLSCLLSGTSLLAVLRGLERS